MNFKTEYIAHLESRGLAGSTIHTAKRAMRLFENWLRIGAYADDEKWNKELLEKYYEYLGSYSYTRADNAKTGYIKDKTLRKYVTRHLSKEVRITYFLCIKQYMKYCLEQNIIYANPFDRIHVRMRVGKKIVRDVSEKNIAELTEVIPADTFLGYRNRTIIEVMYGSGIRLSEVKNLNMEDIDFKEGLLRVKQGKGCKDRNVPLCDVSASYLKEYIREVRRYLLCVEKQTENAVFLSVKGNRLDKCSISRMIRDYCREAGIQGITPHRLRHAFSLHMLRSGCDIRFIQEILGHEELETTQIYTEIFDGELKEKIEQYHPLSSGME